MFVGEEIPDYSFVQLTYEGNKAGIDYYSLNSRKQNELTIFSVYNKKLLAVDIVNVSANYKMFFLASLQIVQQEYGEPDRTKPIDGSLGEAIWKVDDINIIVSCDEKDQQANLTFLSIEVLKQWISQTSII